MHERGYFRSEGASVQVPNPPSIDVDRIVNQYLQETSKKLVRDQFEANKAVEAARAAIKIKKEKDTILQSQPPPEAQFHKANEVSVRNQNPTLVLPGNVPLEQQIDKEEYARQFIENARQGGYHIELNDNLEVIKATPLRQPSQIDSFEITPSN